MRLDSLRGVATGRNESGGSHLLGILLFVVRVTDHGDVCPQSLGEDDCKMSKTSESYNTNVLGGLSGTVLNERRVNGRTSTKHRGGLSRVKVVGNGDDESGGTSPVVCVSTV